MNNENNNNNENKQCNDDCCCGNTPKTTSAGKNVFAETMKEGMSKAFSGIKVAMVAILTSICLFGCKSVPSADKIESVSRLAGTSAAMVVNMTKIDDKSKAVITEIMDIVSTTVPQTNQTFTEVWIPIAKGYVDKMVAEGKIDAGQSQLILSGFTIVCNGIDYIFDVRYPKARTYKELVEAAVHGFVDGYKSVSSQNALKSGNAVPYDQEVYDYLRKKNSPSIITVK